MTTSDVSFLPALQKISGIFQSLEKTREKFPTIGIPTSQRVGTNHWKTALVGFFVLMLSLAGFAAQAPKDVPPEVWAKIGPQVERQMYAFNAEGRASNREQDFQVAAEAAGLAVNDALRLRAMALNGEPLPEAAPVVRDNRVEYPRGAVTEWFENRTDGLEQGFTVEKPEGGNLETVELDIAVETEMAMELAADGQAIIFSQGSRRFKYDKLMAWDATGKTLASTFELAAAESRIRIVCDVRDAQYPITIDPILTSMETKLTASDKVAHDEFGYSVSVDGDVALVGTPYASPGGLNWAGAAYVYERNAGGTNAWGQVAKLTASDKATNDFFGTSVSVAGDVALVGAAAASPGGESSAGAAYVFERNAGGTNAWGQVAKLTAFDKAEGDYFGNSVSVDGDVALVAAPYADPDGRSFAGAAYVYERNAGGTNAWGQVAKLTASDKAANDSFGWSVSVAGDVALVGAYLASPGGVFAAGAAYVYERNAGGTNAWGEVAKLTASDKEEHDNFGYSVCVAGDVALVGAYGASPGGLLLAGAAYVFERNAGGTNAWGEVANLTASDGAALDWFGCSVSVAGDVALIGACQADIGGMYEAGAAYVFERNAGGVNAWGEVSKLTASDPVANDYFGWSVSVAGDVALVGAPFSDPGGTTDAGAAYVIPFNREDWREKAKLTASDGVASNNFGYSVSVDGDVALVGAYLADPGGVTNAGAAYVFERNAGGTNAWGQVAKLTASDGTASDYFGKSVSVDGDVALVAAYESDPNGVLNAGATYIFERNAGGTNAWGQVAKLTASDLDVNNYFGRSVSVDGDVALVGAYYATVGAASHGGAAYVFERNAGGTNAWGQVAKLTASDGATWDHFGWSVSVDGDVALVGSQKDPYGLDDAGVVYVFERNAEGTNAWGEVTKLIASDPAEWALFGDSLSVAGDVALIGSPRASPGGVTNAGAAYVFERDAGGTNAWGQVAKLTASDPAVSAYFGVSVSADGDVALVGAYGASPDDVLYSGAAYVFERNSGGTNAWGEVARLTASDKAYAGLFGSSVSVAGDVALIGAYGAFPTNVSAAYIFEGLIYSNATAEMSVLGTNGVAIASDEAAGTAAGTDFGSFPWGQSRTNMFAITNAGGLALSISGVTTNGAGADSFTVLALPATVSAGSASNFFVVFSPATAQTYTCVVAIANSSINTPYNLCLSGTGAKQDQTITFPAIPDQRRTNVVHLAATASSGLPVSFTVGAGPGSIDGTGTNLTFNGAGEVSIVASQAGAADWNPAANVTNTFRVRGGMLWTDYDGDQIADMAVYDVTNGNWYIRNVNGDVLCSGTNFGNARTVTVPGDYDGDGSADLVVYDEARGNWYAQKLSGELLMWRTNWGFAGAVPVPGDYNGDGSSDLAVYDEAHGNWYVRTLSGDVLMMGTNWGFAGAVAVPGDYNGDGTSDMAVYDQARGNWYVRTLQGDVLTSGTNWGYAGTTPVSGDYDADGTSDLAVYDELLGDWYIRSFNGPILLWKENWGFWGAVPVPGDYDGDGFADMAVYGVDGLAIQAGYVGNWYIRRLNGDVLLFNENWGAGGFAPVNGE